MIWTIKLSEKEDFVKELSCLDFVKIEDHGEDGVLVLTNKSMGRIKRFFNGDWLFQIQRDVKTKDWYAFDLECITNCKNTRELQSLLGVINKFASSEAGK